MNIFVKPVEDQTCRSKLLFIMGATWHTQCMFDLDCNEDSFADILQQRGIESYTYNHAGIDNDVVVNAHQQNVLTALDTIKKHNIDCVVAYSYGAVILLDMLDQMPSSVRHIVLLDPYAALLQQPAELVDQGNKKIVNKHSIQQMTSAHGSTANDKILQAYIDAFCTGHERTIPVYPLQALKQNFVRFHSADTVKKLDQHGVKIVFTDNARDSTVQQFPEHMYIRINNSSHWILIEPARHQLADYIECVINSDGRVPI